MWNTEAYSISSWDLKVRLLTRLNMARLLQEISSIGANDVFTLYCILRTWDVRLSR